METEFLFFFTGMCNYPSPIRRALSKIHFPMNYYTKMFSTNKKNIFRKVREYYVQNDIGSEKCVVVRVISDRITFRTGPVVFRINTKFV